MAANFGDGASKRLAPYVVNHHMFMSRTSHVRRSTPSYIILCELGQVPLHLFWYKMLLHYVGRLVDLPNDRLVKQAVTHAQQQQTTWFQKLVI